MPRPLIRIIKASTGHYLYKLTNRKDFIDNWRFSYWVLSVEYIFEHLDKEEEF